MYSKCSQGLFLEYASNRNNVKMPSHAKPFTEHMHPLRAGKRLSRLKLRHLPNGLQQPE